MYTSIKGTEEYFFEDARLFHTVEEKARLLFSLYNYSEIILPILETGAVFIRGVGDTSDIVTKQIYRLAQKEEIVLRPEGTSQVVRSYVQNGFDKRKEFAKFFYIGAMFRGENPQKGRLREFHHIGAECLGSSSAFIDAEIIRWGHEFLQGQLGIVDYALHINSIGCAEDKKKFSALIKHRLEEKKQHLCENCQKRLISNPLRVLDCKNHDCRAHIKVLNIAADDYLCEQCLSHREQVYAILTAAQIPFTAQPTLVRGLDYYTGIVFEFTTTKLGSQDALGAGGRYDGLVAQLGGEPTPACGFAFGIERLLLMIAQQYALEKRACIYIAPLDQSSTEKAFALADRLRKNDFNVDMDFSGKSLKSQLRYSQKINASIVIMIGDEELRTGSYTIKNMATAEQQKVSDNDLIETVRRLTA